MIRESMAADKLILQSFDRGDYQKVVELGQSGAESSLSATLVIGALSFLGRRWEAEELFKNQADPFGRNFFLGLAATRESKYEEAQSYFEKNMKLLRASDEEDSSLFFTWQGLGFYQFFTGDTEHLLPNAEKAYRAALRMDFKWGQAMSLDLVAHGSFLEGRVQESFGYFDQAISLTKKMKADFLRSGYEISRTCYQAQVSSKPAQALEGLSKAMERLSAQDTYSRNTLALEVFRQYLHAGRFDEAQELFAQVSPGIYRSKNRRQIATLLHRYAHMLLLLDRRLEALTVVRSARMNLIDQVDRLHILRLMGLERRITGTSPTEQELEQASSQVTHFINHRIQNRQRSPFRSRFPKGSDGVGDLLDLAHENPLEALPLFLKAGLWGLIPSAFDWSQGGSRMILDVDRGRALVHVREKCFLSAKALRGYPRKVLEALRGEAGLSKRQIVERVWGYRYEAERHDSLLHSTLRQLRLQIGGDARVIDASDDKYRLLIPIEDRLIREESLGLSPVSSLAVPENFSLPQDLTSLNARQIRILRQMKSGLMINIREYKKIFDVCHMTAYRDLTELTQKNFFQRIGKGRSTCYVRVSGRDIL